MLLAIVLLSFHFVLRFILNAGVVYLRLCTNNIDMNIVIMMMIKRSPLLDYIIILIFNSHFLGIVMIDVHTIALTAMKS